MIIVHYGEIALKGKNRDIFEKQLCQNIKHFFEHSNLDGNLEDVKIERVRGRIIITNVKEGKGLERVFGIINWSYAELMPSDLDELCEKINQILPEIKEPFAVRCQRGDKSFPQTSVEVETKVGGWIKEKTLFDVNLTSPAYTLYLEIFEGNIYRIFNIYFNNLSISFIDDKFIELRETERL